MTLFCLTLTADRGNSVTEKKGRDLCVETSHLLCPGAGRGEGRENSAIDAGLVREREQPLLAQETQPSCHSSATYLTTHPRCSSFQVTAPLIKKL